MNESDKNNALMSAHKGDEMSKKDSTKSNETREIKLDHDTENIELVFCDVIDEQRINDTYYITGIQLDPQEKLAAVNNNKSTIKVLKRVTLVMSRDTYSNYLNTHNKYTQELKKSGVLEDEA